MVDTVTNSAYTANALNQYTDITTSTTANPVYDADGNIVDDGTKTLEWDGENRLMKPLGVSPCIYAETV
jgi:hypothetical protein